eukprot:1557461-Pleurochrysis_carterae.AAC.1
MFQKQGTRTYLNDELRLVLPNDNHVCIREISTNYIVTLASDTFVYAVTGENNTVERMRGQVGQFDGQFKDLVHARLGHFSIDRINASVKHVRDIERQLRRTQTVVLA